MDPHTTTEDHLMDGLRITKLQRDPAGHWTCNVSLNGTTISCHRRHGSWQTDRTFRGRVMSSQHLLPVVAAAIQEQVRRIEARERRQAAAAQQPQAATA